MAVLIDHLWQSAWFLALVYALAALLRDNSAGLRLWLWRAAALKFLLPFSLLHAFGAWLGFPVRHSAIPPPEFLTRFFDMAAPLATPAQSVAWSNAARGAGMLGSLLLTAGGLWLIVRMHRRTAKLVAAERSLVEAGSNLPDAPGLLKTALLAGSALALLVVPVTAGALRDRELRQQALLIDTMTLRAAEISLAESGWRFGDRTEIVATLGGVVIRRTNLQDLVAMVYGIGKFEIFGGAMPWLEHPHYDVQITGPISAPALFDPYSLREPMTNYLYREFGVSIRVNGACQQPCRAYESFIIERLPRCTKLLGAHPECS